MFSRLSFISSDPLVIIVFYSPIIIKYDIISRVNDVLRSVYRILHSRVGHEGNEVARVSCRDDDAEDNPAHQR